jgi:epidermal growth factor receptor substrate 15
MSSVAQTQVPFTFFVTNTATGKTEPGVSVRVLSGSSVVQSGTVDNSGKLTLNVPGGKKYKVEMSKAGKVTRVINLDLTNVVDEVLQGNSAPKGSVEMSMIDEVPGFDFSYVSTNAATEYFYDPNLNPEKLAYDEIVADKYRKKVAALLKEAEKLKGQSDAAFNAAIKKADGLYTAKNYPEALTAYNDALKLKPMDDHANKRYLEVEGILKAQKATGEQAAQAENEYKALIASADQLFAQKKYDDAKKRYQEALAKKSEQYAKDQIGKIDAEIARLAKEAENEGKYTAARNAGDGFMKQNSFQAARDQYKEALKWKQGDPYVTGKLAEIDGKLNAQKADQDKQKQYNDANAAGDALFQAEKWAEAKVEYDKALAIQPSSTYTQGKLAEIKAKLDELAKAKEKEAQIAKLLAEGDTEFKGSKWPAAKAKYQEVIKLDAANAVAAARITEIDAKLASEKADADKLAKIKQLIAEGDALAKAVKLADARSKYQEAIALKADPAVQAKIDAIDAQLLAESQKADLKAKYDKAMQDGEAAFTAGSYQDAVAKFTEAKTIDPSQAVPPKRIEDANKKIAEIAAGAKKEEQYNAAMAAGNSAFGLKDLAGAEAKFKEAVAIDGTKPEAKARLKEVQDLLAADAAAKANSAKYEAAVKAGGELIAAKKLTEAKAKFQEAATLDPSAALPGQKIQEIDAMIAQADRQKQVETLLGEGNTAFGKKDLSGARAKYQQVLTLDSGNAVASGRLQEIAKLESDAAGAAEKDAQFKALRDEATSLMAQAKYAEARQKLVEAKAVKADPSIDPLIRQCDDKLAEMAATANKDQRYRSAYDAGVAAISANRLPEAKAKLNEAIAIDGTKTEAKTKLKEVEDLIAADAANKANATIEQNYNALVAEGQSLEAAKQYDAAIAKYGDALKVKDAQLPKDRIAAIGELKKQAAEQAKNDQKYGELIAAGDELVKNKQYEVAIARYNEALGLKPNDKLAFDKAAEAQRLAQESSSSEDAAFQSLMSKGQKFIDEKNYSKAKEVYERALGFRSEDPRPKQKLQEIEQLIKAEQALAEKQAAYNKKVADAEAAAGAGNLSGAISLFEAAKTIKPDETVPDNRIAELRAQIDGNAAAAAQATEQRFQQLMSEGNASAAGKDYQSALGRYNEALGVKKGDKAAQAKVSEMEQLLDDLARSNSKKAELDKLIAKADAEFKKENWLPAKRAYEDVLAVDATNAYAQNQAKLAEEKERAKSIGEEDANYRKLLAAADKSFDRKDYNKAIEYYKRAVNVKSSDPYPKQRLKDIDGILNPKPAANPNEPQPLQALGNPNNSLSDDALAKAENERKSRKSVRFRRRLEKISDSDSQASAQERENALGNGSQIDETRTAVEEQNVVSNDQQVANAGVLYDKQKTLQNDEIASGNYERSDVMNNEAQLNSAEVEIEQQNGALDGGYMDNSEKLKTGQAALQDLEWETSQGNRQARLENNALITQTTNSIEDKNSTDIRIASRESQDYISTNKAEIEASDDNDANRMYKSVEVTDGELRQFGLVEEVKQQEAPNIAQQNSETLKKDEQIFINTAASNEAGFNNNTLQARAVLDDMQDDVEKTGEDIRVESIANTERLKSQQSRLQDIEREDFNANMVQAMRNDKTFVRDQASREAAGAEESKVSGNNAGELRAIDKGRDEAAFGQAQTETDKAQRNQQSMNGTKNAITDQETGNAATSAGNQQTLDVQSKNISDQQNSNQLTQQQRSQQAQKLLSSLSSKELKFNQAVANDLGKLYPEGVSQEQFENKDSDGLLQNVVTRRIVVKDGRGDVYVRTQDLSATTYSKNGEAVTEYVWIRDTQDARLKRNY